MRDADSGFACRRCCIFHQAPSGKRIFSSGGGGGGGGGDDYAWATQTSPLQACQGPFQVSMSTTVGKLKLVEEARSPWTTKEAQFSAHITGWLRETHRRLQTANTQLAARTKRLYCTTPPEKRKGSVEIEGGGKKSTKGATNSHIWYLDVVVRGLVVLLGHVNVSVQRGVLSKILAQTPELYGNNNKKENN